ncbi:MAG: sodium:calcium antiporter [Thaumarchaeota archaeon]|nr:sodium:calcium antiporter [Nitrososphaerota archaeon]MDE1866839.1 sodium:calcium antiporter [Nitrososphaerota archaeon]
MANDFVMLLLWLGELLVSSWFLSEGAEHLSERWGGRFVGRTLLSVATTLPEIGIVTAAVKSGSYDTALGSALGSNLFMMTLGLAVMLIIATTRLSKSPQKFIDVTQFKMDKILLVITSVVGAVLFVNGYDMTDGILFSGLFGTYLYLAYREMKKEKTQERFESELHETTKKTTKHFARSMLFFAVGTVGIFFGAGPFVNTLQGTASDLGLSVVVLAVIVSPIAGEMPEKISMILLARKGSNGASIAIANVLGSKIVNNTLLLSVAIFAAIGYKGLGTTIKNTSLLENQMILVTVITIVALIPMFRNKMGLRSGMMLLALYAIGIGFQFVLSGH